MLAVLDTELPIGMRPVSHEAGKCSDGGHSIQVVLCSENATENSVRDLFREPRWQLRASLVYNCRCAGNEILYKWFRTVTVTYLFSVLLKWCRMILCVR